MANPGLAQAAPAISATEWKGEYFKANQGIISLEAQTQGFSKTGMLANESEPLQVKIRHTNNKKLYLISQPLATSKNSERSLYWKVETGRYKVEAITWLQGKILRKWTGSAPSTFVVNGMSLSNLGTWLLRPKEPRQLQVSFNHAEVQSYRFPYGTDALRAIVDGFSGRELKRLAGKDFNKKASKNFAGENELRSAFSRQRTITMVYKLDLKRYNKFYKKFFGAIRKRENNFRQCFLDSLELADDIKGSVLFSFALNQKNGIIDTLQHKGGTLKDRRTIDCLSAELGQTEVPVKVAVKGSLQFYFQVK